MWLLAVVLAVVGVVVIVAGVVVYANGVGVDAHGQTEGERVQRGFAKVPYRDMFGHMPKSVRVVTDSESSRRERLMAGGAFVVLVGIVLLVLAVLAAIVAIV